MLESIRELRRRKNFTLRQLSEKTGYTVSFLSQLERGIKNPSLDALRAIAQALDVSLVSLMNNSDYTAGSRGETGDDAGESGFCVLPPDGRRTMPIDRPLPAFERAAACPGPRGRRDDGAVHAAARLLLQRQNGEPPLHRGMLCHRGAHPRAARGRRGAARPGRHHPRDARRAA